LGKSTTANTIHSLTRPQDAWDQSFMQNNVAFDPAANPWGGSNSPNNNMFTSTSSPESQNDSSYGMNSNYYSQSIGGVMGGPMDMNKTDGPVLSASTPGNNNDQNQSAGEVFMGVQSPQPGGVPSWKWTVMNDGKS
jgi:hypothetical protein